MAEVKYIISDSGNITLVIQGWQHQIAPDHPYYLKILQMLEAEESPEKIMEFADIKGSIGAASEDIDDNSKEGHKMKENMDEGMTPGMAALGAAFEGILDD